MNIPAALSVLSAAFAFAAGFFWFWSTQPRPNEQELAARHDGGKRANAERRRIEITVSSRNAWGAICAGVSAELAAAATLISLLGDSDV